MVESGGYARLALKALTSLAAFHLVRGQKLQSHPPVEARVFRGKHNPHAAAADLLQNAVVQNLHSGTRWKRRRVGACAACGSPVAR